MVFCIYKELTCKDKIDQKIRQKIRAKSFLMGEKIVLLDFSGAFHADSRKLALDESPRIRPKTKP